MKLNQVFHDFLLRKSESIFPNENEIPQEIEGVDYFKDLIFDKILKLALLLATPIYIIDIGLFISETRYLVALMEACFFLIHIALLINKKLPQKLRKVLFVAALYFLGILIVITTGGNGSGMVVISISMILAALILETQIFINIFIANILVFIPITLSLYLGFLNEMQIASYKPTWILNVVLIQFFGFVGFSLISFIFRGINKQMDYIKRANQKVLESEIRHKVMIKNISDIIAIIDKDGNFSYVTDNINTTRGLEKNQLIGENILDRASPEDRERARRELDELINNPGMKKKIELKVKTFEDKNASVEVTAVNLLEDPSIQGILINYHDITDRKTYEEKILYLNHHDSLTGLYNRYYFDKEKLNEDIESNLPISVITLDLDGLKLTNDALGHEQGDKIIKRMAQILRESCREDDIIARVGGDEFYILLPKTTLESAKMLTERIKTNCEEYNQLNTKEPHYISASIGYDTKESMEQSIDDVLRKADNNMYNDKSLSKRKIDTEMILAIKRALFNREPSLEEKTEKIKNLAIKLGQALDLSKTQVEGLQQFIDMKDIGLVCLERSSPEREKHCEFGHRIAKTYSKLKPISDAIYYQEEKWDGSGYPTGLKGEGIPLYSRIVSVVEAYYNIEKENLDENRIKNKLKDKKGKELDPNIVEIFINTFNS